MPKLRRVSGRQAIRALERLGFERYGSAAATWYSRSRRQKVLGMCRASAPRVGHRYVARYSATGWGDAETTLGLALTHLDQAAAFSPESEREAITTIQAHLTQAASRLREQPILAAQDLEGAWYGLDALIAPK